MRGERSWGRSGRITHTGAVEPSSRNHADRPAHIETWVLIHNNNRVSQAEKIKMSNCTECYLSKQAPSRN